MASNTREYEAIDLERHTSAQFDAELEDIRERVLSMGGLVEQQVADSAQALVAGDGELGERVAHQDYHVNSAEVDIDEQCTRIIAKRQPQASDLRLVLAIAKTITDLERIGDEAEKIGRFAAQAASRERPANAFRQIDTLATHVRQMMRDALDAFARLDAEAALAVAQADEGVDREYESAIRECMTFMMEDPRTISPMLDVLWAVKALERIGDHATNIGEYVVYLVGGRNVRHTSVEAMEQVVAETPRVPRQAGG
ncbi:phosphate signaling complex protein PhoU [Salinisphaera sp. USBA-960]|uniref:phosphate signaling complex protein PhoU n=1 Tax=Salinisphaera orenii TaxID=856731 RepID=UPI000DBE7E5C|nr:phosphate signaling complex protein PhoU [Salifodinibacter halophilus]NNC26558.1 phosphate signaling complex protein PhoU [Salifodinibacter halophilus]